MSITNVSFFMCAMKEFIKKKMVSFTCYFLLAVVDCEGYLSLTRISWLQKRGWKLSESIPLFQRRNLSAAKQERHHQEHKGNCKTSATMFREASTKMSNLLLHEQL